MTLAAFALALFPWKTLRKEAPYGGRTHRKDGAAKMRADLLEMREFMIDHRSYTHNLSSCEIKA